MIIMQQKMFWVFDVWERRYRYYRFPNNEREEEGRVKSVGEEKALFCLVPKYNAKNNKENKIIIE